MYLYNISNGNIDCHTPCVNLFIGNLDGAISARKKIIFRFRTGSPQLWTWTGPSECVQWGSVQGSDEFLNQTLSISIFTNFLPVLVQACTRTESSQASSETSYVQILTSTFIKFISVSIQPGKKMADANVYP